MHWLGFCPECDGHDGMEFKDPKLYDDGSSVSREWKCTICGGYGYDLFNISDRVTLSEDEE